MAIKNVEWELLRHLRITYPLSFFTFSQLFDAFYYFYVLLPILGDVSDLLNSVTFPSPAIPPAQYGIVHALSVD